MTPSILILAGPTASGKTALSLHGATRLGGEIVNCDSMQVYAGLDLLSAQPGQAEKAAAPHHLFGVLDPSERCSVGRWARLAMDVIHDIRGRGHTPILVGGTGLYFKVLIEGLAPAPDIPDAVLAGVDALFAAGGIEALRAEAERIDPAAAARIKGADRQRLMRVVAVGRATGRALTELQAETAPLIDPAEVCALTLAPGRSALYARIEARFDAMVEAGAVDEVRALARRDLAPDLPAMKAVGVPPLLAYLRGGLELGAAIEVAKRDSRRYAKRQFTWFSNQHPDWPRIACLDPAAQRRELDARLETAFPERCK